MPEAADHDRDDRPAPTAPLLSRRRALLGGVSLLAVGGAVAACSSSTSVDATTPPAVPTATPDPSLVDEQALIDRYAATIAAYPALAPVLTAIRDQHVAHLSALGGVASTTSAPVSVATTAQAAVGALIDAERTAMRLRLASCVDETAADRARILAYVAASEGSHIPELKRVKA